MVAHLFKLEKQNGDKRNENKTNETTKKKRNKLAAQKAWLLLNLAATMRVNLNTLLRAAFIEKMSVRHQMSVLIIHLEM